MKLPAARAALAALIALTALAGCATAPAPVRPGPERPDAEYLLDPIASYPLEAHPAAVARVQGAHRELLASEAIGGAELAASELLAADPAFHPAAVLSAQAAMVGKDYQAVVDRLAPVVAELPTYRAAALLLGRAAELLGDIPAAYAAFRGAEEAPEGNALAARRAAELRDRAIEIVATRVDEALAKGRIEDAERELARLRSWAPGELVTLEADRAAAAAKNDGAGELVAIQRLLERRPDDLALLERRGDLELFVGDPGEGLRTFQLLSSRDPANAALAAKLERAKFLWRLQMLPPEVRELWHRPELTRGDFAALLYWLIPEVRRGQVTGARIASDVLDHRFREEIVHVVNRGLMQVDETLHRFTPDRPLRRGSALEALLRLPILNRNEHACLTDLRINQHPTWELICRVSHGCGLLDSESDCVPGAGLSGLESVDLMRRTIELLRGRPGAGPPAGAAARPR